MCNAPRHKPRNVTVANYEVQRVVVRPMCMCFSSRRIFSQKLLHFYMGMGKINGVDLLPLLREYYSFVGRDSKWKAFGRFPWSFHKVFHYTIQ